MQQLHARGLMGLMVAFVVLFGACEKYEPQYEGAYEDPSGPVVQPGASYEMVYVQGNALFMATRSLTGKKQITVSGLVEKASINYAHDRIAYKTASGITIIDTAGIQIGVVPNSANVKWFDWHANDQTLYMLRNDNSLAQYGPTVTLATTNVEDALPFFPATDVEISSVAVQPDGTVLIPFSLYGGLNYYRGIYVYHKAGVGGDYWINLQYDLPTRIRIDKTGNQALLASTNGSNQDNIFKLSIEPNAYLEATGINVLLGAISSDGLNSVMWDAPNNVLFLRNNNNLLPTGAAPVVDLDW